MCQEISLMYAEKKKKHMDLLRATVLLDNFLLSNQFA